MSKNTRTRILLTAVAALLLVAMTVGGTLAWLQDVTKEVKNTFTTTNIDIDLNETATNFEMIPGNTIAKDPVVTIYPTSEASYIFVKITESANFDTYFEQYTIAEGWTVLTNDDIDDNKVTVLYRTVDKVTAQQNFPVLAGGTNGQVKVLTTVTNAMMDAAKGTGAPTLTFEAYAVQQANLTVDAAWDIAQNLKYENDSYGTGIYTTNP